jgi:hypothetical protein
VEKDDAKPDNPFSKRLAESCITVIDNCSHVFVEALTANKPTILIWEPQLWELDSESDPYCEELRQAGILYDLPEDAAAKVAEIYDNPYVWWNSEKVQKAKQHFLDRYALLKDDALDFWVEALNEELALSYNNNKIQEEFNSSDYSGQFVVDIINQTRIINDSDKLWKFNVEKPQSGNQIWSSQLTIGGWILSKSASIVKLEFINDNRVIHETILNSNRPDVLKNYPDIESTEKCGFITQVNVKNLENTISIAAVFDNQIKLPFYKIEFRKVPLSKVEVVEKRLSLSIEKVKALKNKLSLTLDKLNQ